MCVRSCIARETSRRHFLLEIGVGEADWVFKTTFSVTDAEHALPNIDLVFDGLDTYATVKLVSFSPWWQRIIADEQTERSDNS